MPDPARLTDQQIEKAIGYFRGGPEPPDVLDFTDWADAIERLDAALRAEWATNETLRAALKRIADHPTEVRNPDGDDQAAHEMQLIAQDALDRLDQEKP